MVLRREPFLFLYQEWGFWVNYMVLIEIVKCYLQIRGLGSSAPEYRSFYEDIEKVYALKFLKGTL